MIFDEFKCVCNSLDRSPVKFQIKESAYDRESVSLQQKGISAFRVPDFEELLNFCGAVVLIPHHDELDPLFKDGRKRFVRVAIYGDIAFVDLVPALILPHRSRRITGSGVYRDTSRTSIRCQLDIDNLAGFIVRFGHARHGLSKSGEGSF